jgi:hypothetical protein
LLIIKVKITKVKKKIGVFFSAGACGTLKRPWVEPRAKYAWAKMPVLRG